jgi:hypothetical protein
MAPPPKIEEEYNREKVESRTIAAPKIARPGYVHEKFSNTQDWNTGDRCSNSVFITSTAAVRKPSNEEATSPPARVCETARG